MSTRPASLHVSTKPYTSLGGSLMRALAASPYIIPLEAGPRGKAGSNQTSSSGQARPNATQLGQRSLILHTVCRLLKISRYVIVDNCPPVIVCFAVVGGLQLLYWRNKQLDAIIRHVEYFVIVICLAQFSILGELSAETGALVKPFGGRAFWSTGED